MPQIPDRNGDLRKWLGSVNPTGTPPASRASSNSTRLLKITVVEAPTNDRSALLTAITGAGYEASAFDDGDRYLGASAALDTDCLIVGVHAPPSSARVIVECVKPHFRGPILLISACRQVGPVLAALRAGACEYLEEPLNSAKTVTAIQNAIEGRLDGFRYRSPAAEADLINRFGHLLTGREKDVVLRLVAGLSSRQIGQQLGISPRTVDIYRTNVMVKLNVRRTVDLVRMAFHGAEAPRLAADRLR